MLTSITGGAETIIVLMIGDPIRFSLTMVVADSACHLTSIEGLHQRAAI